jgi:hypothetical protein
VSNLVIEILLRLVKPAAAVAIGIIVFAIAVALGQEPSWPLGLLCFLSGAAFILLVQESPL